MVLLGTVPGVARHRALPTLRTTNARHHGMRKHICCADPAPFDVKRFEQLDSSYRNKVLDAVQKLSNRATAAEVAAEAGIPIKEADRYMQSLVQDVQGGMQVSSAGDLVYTLPGDYRARLLRNSLKLRLEPTFKAVAASAGYLARISFGTALFASILATSIAIIALLSAASSDRNSGRSSRNDDRGWDSAPGFRFHVFHWDPYTPWFWDPYYPVKARQRSPEDMSFLESVFSVVFGDGDPNATYEEERWARVATYIKEHGGVVSAIELAPLLDPPDVASLQDEAYMVPALLKFDGEVKVMDDGSTVYVFPQFQRVTSPTKSSPLPGAARVADSIFGRRSARGKTELASRGQTGPALEQRWRLSKAPTGGKVGAWALGLANIGGVAYLSSLIGGFSARALAANGLSWIPSILPGLQAYAALFAVVPAVRALLNVARNVSIDKRNAARERAAEVLASGSPQVRGKLAQARRLAQTTTIAEDDVVYDSKKGEERVLYEDFASFDRRLADSQRQRPWEYLRQREKEY